MARNFKRGFTLIELSLVVVVIGIILSSIVMVSDIIGQSEIKVVIKEVEEYKIAIRRFKNTHKYFPGDFAGVSVFGVSTPVGNNNWQVSTEESRFVAHHLTLANLYPGEFVGDMTDRFELNVNIPQSIVSGGGYWFHYYSVLDRRTDFHSIDLARINDEDNINNVLLSVNDAQYLDNKFDDGTPNTGRILSTTGENGAIGEECVITDAGEEVYNFELVDNTLCRMHFLYND